MDLNKIGVFMKTALLLLSLTSTAYASDISTLNKEYTVSCDNKPDESLIIVTSGSKPARMEITPSNSPAFDVDVLNQKVLVRVGQSDDMPGKTKTYLKTTFTKKSIEVEQTEKFGMRTKMTYRLNLNFDSEKLESGKVVFK